MTQFLDLRRAAAGSVTLLGRAAELVDTERSLRDELVSTARA
jgi:hypothetical protein